MSPKAKKTDVCEVHDVLTHELISRLTRNEFASLEPIRQQLAMTSIAGDTSFFRNMLRMCLGNQAHKGAAWCLLHAVEFNVQPDLHMYNATILMCAKLGDFRLALELFHLMTRCGIHANHITYNTIINACAQVHDCTQAEVLLHEMRSRGIRVSLVSFTSVVNAFAKVGNVHKVEMWFNELVKAGFQADDVTFNSIINACARAGRIDLAKNWFVRMKVSGLLPNIRSYNSLINACARIGDVPQAEVWMQELYRQGLQADEVTFGSVLNACAKARNAERAEYWIEVMMNSGLMPNVLCFNSVLNAYAQTSDYASALKWFWLMKSFGVDPTRVSYNHIINAYLSAKELTSGDAWLNRMVSDGFRVDRACYLILVRALRRINSQEDASDERASMFAHYMVIKAYAQAGKLQEIQDYVRESANISVLQELGGHFRKELADTCWAKGGEGFAHEVFSVLGFAFNLGDSSRDATNMLLLPGDFPYPRAPPPGTFFTKITRSIDQVESSTPHHLGLLPFDVDHKSAASNSTSSEISALRTRSVGNTNASSPTYLNIREVERATFGPSSASPSNSGFQNLTEPFSQSHAIGQDLFSSTSFLSL